MTVFRIAELRVGRPRPFGPRGQPSAIDKAPVAGAVHVTADGLEGDGQGDPRRHGGPDKALHAYPAAHYPDWAAETPEQADRQRPGAFGENLVIAGATEADICLGDRWQMNNVLLEVSQGRQPCWKLNLRFNVPDMARRVQYSGRTGWYFRVLTPGQIAAGDHATLVARPNPDWQLTRVSRILYHDTLDPAALGALAALPGLPESWRKLAHRRIATARVEDWRSRLGIPGSTRQS